MSTLSLFRGEGDTQAFASGDTIFVEGGVFGEMALIDAAPRSATATALAACTLVPVTSQRLKAPVKESPDFAIDIMRVMAARLRSMDRRL